MKRVLLACVLALTSGIVLAGWHRAGAATCQYGPCGSAATLTVTGVHQAANGVTTVDVTGKGYGANETVLLSAYNPLRSVGTARTSSSGGFSIAVVLPTGYSAGTHTMVGTGTVSGRSASAHFFLSRPSGAVQPCTTSAGSRAGPAPQFVLAACVSTQLPASGPSAPAASQQGGSSLPFTGSDVALTTTAGALAVGTGGLLVLVTRRRRRRKWTG
jgi:LPXTG cell wall anchor motif